jgi:hypothetical protein
MLRNLFRVSMLASVLALTAVSASAQKLPPQPPPVDGPGQGNTQERATCHPDVKRFCQTQLDANPDDVLGILGCLQANRTKISRGCQEVLASHGQ